MTFKFPNLSWLRLPYALPLTAVWIGLDALAVFAALVWSQVDKPSFCFGVGLFLVGLWLRLWTKGYGRNTQEWFMAGPYLYVRHPYILGHWLCLVGAIVVSRNAWVFMAYVILSSVLLLRLVAEADAALTRRFPDVYPEYKKCVSGFFPQLLPAKGSWLRNSQGFSVKRAFKVDDYQEFYVIGAYLFLFGFYAYDMVYDVKILQRIIIGLICAAAMLYVLWRRLRIRSFAPKEI